MTGPFTDLHPGAPRILFVGLPDSSHTHSWMGLLDGEGFNVRLFGVHLVPNDWYIMLNRMPYDWSTPTYISAKINQQVDPRVYYPANRLYWWEVKIRNRLENRLRPTGIPHQVRLFMDVIHEWQPDIIHTLGLEPAGYFVGDVMTQYALDFKGKWVAQVRGGPELTLKSLDKTVTASAKKTFEMCDYIIADNDLNYQIIRDMGIPDTKLPFGNIPGTGGIDTKLLGSLNPLPPSQRVRRIIMPKAYSGIQSTTLTTLEGIKLAWSRIAPCEIIFTNTTPDNQRWIRTFEDDLLRATTIHSQLPRLQLFQLLASSRVMLAPTVLDGVPNVLYESMATGTVPIVSPLETLTPIVNKNEHALFARNLYPNEIADALVLAMNDDSLIDDIAERNRKYIHQLADRDIIQRQIVDFYAKESFRMLG